MPWVLLSSLLNFNPAQAELHWGPAVAVAEDCIFEVTPITLQERPLHSHKLLSHCVMARKCKYAVVL